MRRWVNVPGGDGSTSLEKGAVLSTLDKLYFGFGSEGIWDAATRNAVMGRAMDYLLD